MDGTYNLARWVIHNYTEAVGPEKVRAGALRFDGDQMLGLSSSDNGAVTEFAYKWEAQGEFLVTTPTCPESDGAPVGFPYSVSGEELLVFSEGDSVQVYRRQP